MFMLLTASGFAALLSLGIKPEIDIHLAAGYHRVKLSAYAAERFAATQHKDA